MVLQGKRRIKRKIARRHTLCKFRLETGKSRATTYTTACSIIMRSGGFDLNRSNPSCKPLAKKPRRLFVVFFKKRINLYHSVTPTSSSRVGHISLEPNPGKSLQHS